MPTAREKWAQARRWCRTAGAVEYPLWVHRGNLRGGRFDGWPLTTIALSIWREKLRDPIRQPLMRRLALQRDRDERPDSKFPF